VTTLASAPAGSPSSPSIHPPLRSHPRYSAQGSANCGAMTETLRIWRATADDMTIIYDLIDDARAWLRSKGTDQWAKPWPNPTAHDARVLRGLKASQTWLVEDYDDARSRQSPAATRGIGGCGPQRNS
jgi:hypothetical protein